MFKRKAYDAMRLWKEKYYGRYACLLEGARRVGKSTIAENFARNEYRSFIKVDFANVSDDLLDVFRDISRPDMFFLRLQAETGVTLYERESVILFDEIQLYPKARQAIKYLVADGRYDYIETGSLISIKKNVRDIVIPSEEHKISVYPMDYEEFLWATGGNPELLRKLAEMHTPVGNSTNQTLMRNFRAYLAVGGMPQAVEAYIEYNNMEEVDRVKKEIIDLYYDDFRKVDESGRLSDIYRSIPSQLALKKKRFVISNATGKRKTQKDEERLFDLIDSKTVLPCYDVAQPDAALEQTRMTDRYKLYLSDVGLFTSIIFNSSEEGHQDIYRRLLSDKQNSDLGYLYENAAAQMLTALGCHLYYYTWRDRGTHSHEIDFLIVRNGKVIPIEIKSSQIKSHKSIDEFSSTFSKSVGERYIFSKKDFSKDGMLKNVPIYLMPFTLERSSGPALRPSTIHTY